VTTETQRIDTAPRRAVLAGAAIALAVLAAVAAAVHHSELSGIKAWVLGVVEGLTEYLPVSSTGHLTVFERLMHVGTQPGTKDAADAYAIVIQAGAIIAVLGIFRDRVRSMIAGAAGRDRNGRHLLVVLLTAFVPAAVVGVALEKPVKDHLFGVWPVAVSWAAFGLVILGWVRWGPEPGRRRIEDLTVRDGVVIGCAQVLALWPGTSRSLVTILAALALGATMGAAVEFSFLLGLITLGAATAYEGLKNGHLIVDHFGIAGPVIGFLAALAAAVLAVEWMVDYLRRHSLAIFGWYRIAAAVAAVVLLATVL
jgi:undecaprenyl-diphosphatase